MLKKINVVLHILTLILAIVSLLLVCFGLTNSPVKDIFLILLCILSILLVFVPTLIEKLFKIQIPEFLKLFYIIYVPTGIILGNVYNFYYIIPFWDKILHTCSGALLFISGLILLELLTKAQYIKLNKPVALIIAFIFALAVGTIWEFIEFGLDCLFDANMQRYNTIDGVPFVGQAALMDTMIDMLLAALGTTITFIVAAFIPQKSHDQNLVK